MFKKIVTEFTYSPALAGSLGVYLKKLRNERTKRQIGLLFVGLAVMVQFFATTSPPESANANNPSELINGGVQSIEDYLTYYDQNSESIKDLFDSLSISRSDVENMRTGNLSPKETLYLWSMRDNRQPGSAAYPFRLTSGKTGIAYSQPISSNYSKSIFYTGSSSDGGWFAIEKNTGSLITQRPASDYCNLSEPSTGSPATTLWLTGHQCRDTFNFSLSARAISPSSPTALSMSQPSDRIAYTLTISSKDSKDSPIMPAISLEDLLDYSRILDNGGGVYNFDTRLLTWPETNLSAGGVIERTFVMQVLPVIPSMARGKYVTSSYDCIASASFGTTLPIPVNCPLIKIVEKTTSNLPVAETWLNVAFMATLPILAGYYYFRSRQLTNELYMIRHIHSGGA